MGDSVIPHLTHVVFLHASVEVRIERLVARETARYGQERLETDARLRQSLDAFLEWSRAYDVGGVSRTRQLHEDWMSSLRVPILRMDSGRSVDELTSSSLDFLEI